MKTVIFVLLSLAILAGCTNESVQAKDYERAFYMLVEDYKELDKKIEDFNICYDKLEGRTTGVMLDLLECVEHVKR